MFCFCESNEKRLKSARSKFADASISRLIEDWGPLASEALQRHLSIDFQIQDVIGKIFACSERLMFCVCESNEKRLNSVRSKFADASISQLIEDRGRSEVQPSYRLSKVRETCAAFGTLTWRKYNCAEVENIFFFFYFQRGKGKENFKLCMCWLKPHTQYFYTIVTYDTPIPTITLDFLKERWTWKSSNHFPIQVKCQKIST